MTPEETQKDITDKIELLQKKFKASGQDLSSYLEGLLYADYLNYWDYINLDILLSLQQPKTSFKDEKIFIIYHQITELYFKLIIWELEQITEQENIKANFFKETIEDALLRNYQYSDIAIITRKNKENKLVASYLTEIGIPIKSDESLSLNQSNEVVFVMNIYQLLFDKNNKNAIVAATDYLLEKHNQFNFTSHKEILRNKNSFDYFKNFITETFSIQLPIFNAYSSYELLEEIISVFFPTYLRLE